MRSSTSTLAVLVALALAVTAGACGTPDPTLREPTASQRTWPAMQATVTTAAGGASLVTTPTTATTPSAPSAPSSSGSAAPPSESVAGSTPPSSSPVTLPAGPTTVAQARTGLDGVEVFAEPGATAPTQVVATPGEYGNPQVFVVLERRPDGWLRALLPVRPNGSTGWIREDDVTLVVHDYRISVSLSGFSLAVRRGDDVVLEAPIGVGTSDTPTPAATYYTWVLLAPTNSGYGQYAYGLSGFSEVLDEFSGGDARLGIHGTDDESSIGRNVSHGCIRVSDETIITMVTELGLPLGVPVEVTA